MTPDPVGTRPEDATAMIAFTLRIRPTEAIEMVRALEAAGWRLWHVDAEPTGEMVEAFISDREMSYPDRMELKYNVQMGLRAALSALPKHTGDE